MKKERILIFTPWRPFAHAVRCGEVASCLRGQGFETYYSGRADSAFATRAKQDGVPYYPVEILAGEGHKLSIYYSSESEARKDFEAVRTLIQETQPDMIISDASPMVPLAAESEAVPHASLASAMWTGFYGSKRPWLVRSALAWKIAPLGPLAYRTARRCIWAVAKKRLLRILNSISSTEGLTLRNDGWDYFLGNELTIITDHPAYGLLQSPPQSFHYCGPISWTPDIEEDKAGLELDESRPAVYVSFGSSGPFELLSEVTNWLLESGRQVVITSAFTENSDAAELFSHPHVHARPFIDVSEVLPRCESVIFHGGNGTSYQVLEYKKPSLVIPRIQEQNWNGYRLQEMGVSKLLSVKEQNRAAFLKALDETIEKAKLKYAELPDIGGEIHGDLNGAPRAAAILSEYFAKQKG